jgi:TolA-binding protein
VIVGLIAAVAYLGGRMQERGTAVAPSQAELPSQPTPQPLESAPAPEAAPPVDVQPDKTPAAVPASVPPAPAPSVASRVPKSDAANTPAAAAAADAERTAAARSAAAAIVSELEEVRGKMAAKQYAQAIAGAQSFVEQYPSHRLTPDAYMVLGDAYAGAKRDADAVTAYASVADKFKTSPRAPEALVRQAELVLQSRQSQRESAARQLYTRAAEEYPKSEWAPRALLARAQIEERTRDRIMDASVGTMVPVVLPTYRAVAERYPAESEDALWRMSEIFEDLNRYPLQAQALADLAARFPQTKYDAYWKLGEVRERRLQDKAGAIDAYSKVPASSSKYRNAERKLQDLKKR